MMHEHLTKMHSLMVVAEEHQDDADLRKATLHDLHEAMHEAMQAEATRLHYSVRERRASRAARATINLALLIGGGCLLGSQFGWHVGVAVPLLLMYVRGSEREPQPPKQKEE